MRRAERLLWSAVLAVALGGCPSIVGNDEDWCPGGDPAPFACARLVALIEGPPEPWPLLRHFSLRAFPARDLPGLELGMEADTGAVPVVVVDHLYPIEDLGDTVSMWFEAALLEVPSPPVSGPLPVFAVDSVLHVVRFTAQRIDTVRLTLRRP